MEDKKKLIDNLKLLTESTLKDICTLDVITPKIYRDSFLSNAKNHKIEYDPENNNFDEILIKQINEFQKNVLDTSSILKKSVKEAIVAVKEKDENKLSELETGLKKLDIYIKTLEDALLKDKLTNTHNRRWLFDKFLKNEKFNSSGVISFIDLNNFKSINDNYGHIIGDKVLILFSSLFSELKNTEIVRYAGDEFIIIFTDSNLSSAVREIEKISENLKHKVVHIGDHKFYSSFSSGTVEYKSGDLFELILNRADELMYKDKNFA